jgi:thymidylate synthase (FAD)
MKITTTSYEILRPTTSNWKSMLREIERAGRNCYKSEDKITNVSARKFVAMLIARGHHAMLEHAPNISVLFHVPRGLTHEYVRHRLASFAQESTRFCNYGKGKFGRQITLIPMMDGLNRVQIARRKKLWRELERVYLAEIDEGIRPEQARDNLPICLKSDIVITTNVRHWRLIFSLRDEDHAHPMMRKLMYQLVTDFRQRVPVLFDDVGIK